MDVIEAKNILNATNVDEAIDSYENERFTLKQFLTSNLPTTKLFSSKLKKFARIKKAYETILETKESSVDVQKLTIDYSSENIKETVSLFQENDSQLKLWLMSARTSNEISFYALQLIENYSLFAEKWQLDELPQNCKIKISAVPDPMDLIAAIRQFNEEGKSTFTEIKSLPEDNLLVQEAIRLSLWLKFEKMSETYSKLEEQLALQEWPDVFLFKFIVPNDDEKLAKVTALFDDTSDMKLHHSKTGKYVSVSVKEMMLDVKSIVDKYKKAAEIKGVIAL